jgi:hypothetical protein
MSTGNRRTATLVGSALLLGVAADIVTRTLPERLSLTVWIGLSLLVGFLLVRFRVVSVPRASFLLAGAALLFAIGIAGRDAEALGVLDLLAALSLIVLAAPRSMPARLGAAGVIDYARAAIHSAASSLAGLVPGARFR